MTTTTETPSPSEISSSIVTGMRFVYDLFGEVTSFFRLLSDQLQASDLDAGSPINRRFMLPRSKDERSLVNYYVRTHMGLLAELNQATGEELDDLDEDDEAGDSDDEVTPDKTKKLFQITGDTQFVGVRATLLPKRATDQRFRPSVVAVVLSSLMRAPVKPRRKKNAPATEGPPDTEFKIAHRLLPRLLLPLSRDLKPGGPIACRIPKFELSATVSAVVARDLAEFDSEDSVETFVRELADQADAAS